MFDRDAFEERAAIMEFDGGLSRFDAETQAAKAQGLTRWQALAEVKNADGKRHSERGGDHRPAHVGDGSDNLPGMQRATAEQGGPVSVGDVPAGRRGVVLSPLRT